MNLFTKRERILIVLIAVLLFLNIYQFFLVTNKKDTSVVYDLTDMDNVKSDIIKSEKSTSEVSKENISKKCVVYVCGNVKNPGVYELSQNDRINDAIIMAGGALPKSDLTAINLAEKLTDGQKIYVPKIGESIQLNRGTNSDYQNTNTSSDSNNQGNKININTATKEQLKTLNRIGDKLAERIIEYREKNGPFKSTEELKNVNGIGDKIFESIKDSIVAQ